MAIDALASFGLIDADGVPASLDLNLHNTSDLLADILSFLAALAPKIDLIVDGKITKIRLSVDVPLPGGLKGSATAGGEVERTGLFNFLVNGSSHTFSIDVPSQAPIYFQANQVLSGNANVASFVAAMTTAANATQVTTPAQQTLSALKAATKRYRKHRRALARA